MVRYIASWYHSILRVNVSWQGCLSLTDYAEIDVLGEQSDVLLCLWAALWRADVRPGCFEVPSSAPIRLALSLSLLFIPLLSVPLAQWWSVLLLFIPKITYFCSPSPLPHTISTLELILFDNPKHEVKLMLQILMRFLLHRPTCDMWHVTALQSCCLMKYLIKEI